MTAVLNYLKKEQPAARPTRFDFDTSLRVSCGCGKRFPNVPLGELHAEETGHTLHILGEIRALKN